jgi:hypothetical protein
MAYIATHTHTSHNPHNTRPQAPYSLIPTLCEPRHLRPYPKALDITPVNQGGDLCCQRGESPLTPLSKQEDPEVTYVRYRL